MAYQMDFFAGLHEKVTAAIEAGKVQYPAYVFVRDNEESTTGRLAFVDQNNVLKFIRGENKQQVLNVTELPDVSEGDTEVLYVFEGIVYSFNGEEYVPSYKDHTSEIEALTERVTALENKDAELAGQIETLSEKINAIEIPEECKCGAEYEFTNVPTGTLVSYREDEIRIMCPVNTEWAKQTVGDGGDPNSYYGTLKVYVPNDAVTGYIEHLNDETDSEILTSFSIDEKGRRYQPTWLALAKYDETTATWTYYGEKSTVNKYIGWDYRIDWYDADNVMIASDNIRINLSNEDCHYVIEPYYIEKLETKVAALEETVETLENSTGGTFTELE